MAVSLRKLAARYDYTCCYCHKRFPLSQLSREHLIPRSVGGKSSGGNIFLACKRCNQRVDTNMHMKNLLGNQRIRYKLWWRRKRLAGRKTYETEHNEERA